MVLDSYAEHPVSVTEVRAHKSQKAKDWTARDALIDTLRRIDSGELNPTALVICIGALNADGTTDTHYSNFAGNVYQTLGLLERVKYMLQERPS